MAPTVQDERLAGLAADARGIAFHYDLPPAFCQHVLDPTLSSSCHYVLTPDDSLAQAALNKLDLVAREFELSAEDPVLGVGCGWDSFVL